MQAIAEASDTKCSSVRERNANPDRPARWLLVLCDQISCFVCLSYDLHRCCAGVPEALETMDYFSSVTLFRRHHFVVPLSSQASAPGRDERMSA